MMLFNFKNILTMSSQGRETLGRGDPKKIRLPGGFQLLAIAIIFQLAIFNNVSFASTQDTYAFLSKADSDRYSAFIQEIRCVVCQNQNIADSNAPLANDLRKKIYNMMLDKKSDNEIKNFLVSRYGEFILLKPRFNKLTLLLWSFPFLSLVLILMFFLTFRVKNHKNNTISL